MKLQKISEKEQKKAAKEFVAYWKDKGYEKGQSQPFWMELLQKVYGVEDPAHVITFEDKVALDHTSFIDGHIPETKVLIEQKSLGKDLNKPIKQSDGSFLTPFQQAKRYSAELPYSQRPRWIVTSNFSEFRIYDMEKPNGEPEIILLKDLPKEYYRMHFLVDTADKHIQKEMEVSLKAGEIVGNIYDALLKEYKDPNDPKTLENLNILCVRLVFLLYAEDAQLLGSHLAFHDYLQTHKYNARDALIKLFKILDTKPEDRDPYEDDDLLAFPYVNGGLFANEKVVVPKLNDKILGLLLKHASEDFDWSTISPTIFGAVFESTLNPETRRSGGMHYTSLENIHKVIDPLFLSDLKDEFEKIKEYKVKGTRDKKLHEFQDKLGSLVFLDPACGSGNFLTETYISLRRLENQVLKLLNEGQQQFGFLGSDISPIKVTIENFNGIEINDFAVTVAKTALWIAESQMLKETEEILLMDIDFFPLKTQANIVEGNALRIDWDNVVSRNTLSYIMGNPPFVGQSMRTKEQAADIQKVFYPSKNGGKLDYVSGWFKKAADFIKDTRIRVAFVSSNSICQGESVNLLWEMLLTNGVIINFAYTTFKWISEAKKTAAVMCVIVGFSYCDDLVKKLYDGNIYKEVSHINGYLKDAPDVFIKNRSKSINAGTRKVVQGSPPADDGRLLMTKEEKDWWIQKYPELKEVIKPFVGSREFINEIEYTRYCFWFPNTNPAKFKNIPELIDRFNYIRDYRLKSSVDRIQKTADKPFLFTQNRQPDTDYLLIPRVSSSSRRYIPIGFLSPDVIASDSVVLVYDATLYDFGLLSSNVHNSWMRTIAGRLKNDYRYAPSVFYNFPFPNATAEEKARIEKTAKGILEARSLYPEASLADMYGDEMYLYPELIKAHQQNDTAVMMAYHLPIKTTTESSCVAELMKLYKIRVTKNYS